MEALQQTQTDHLHPKGVEVDGYGLMIVDLNNVGYKVDPWVLASTGRIGTLCS
jgi:hypothetical protein